MLSYEQILALIDKLVETPLTEISLTEGEFSLSLKKEQANKEIIVNSPNIPINYAQAQAPIIQSEVQSVTAPSNLIEIKSPMVGTFYAAASPDSEALGIIGKKINIGDTVCIIEAMKVMNELPSEVTGTIEEICVTNGKTVEYGQVLFRLKP